MRKFLNKKKTGGMLLCFAMVCGLIASVHADSLIGLSTITVVEDAIVDITYMGTTYVVDDGDLALGTTTRHYIIGSDEFVWSDEDADNGIIPTGLPTVSGTSTPKENDPGYEADNFLLKGPTGDDMSSIDGIDFQETIFEFPTNIFFLFERGGNDSGFWQAIYADESLGPEVQFAGGTDYANTGESSGQAVYGVAFETDQKVLGVRITASGHDTHSISTPAVTMGPVAIYPKSLPDPAGKNIPADVTFAWTFSDGADVVVDSYTIYMDTDASLVAEPNLPGDSMLIDGTGDAAVILSASATDPNAIYSYSGIAEDTIYYWRVETAVLEPNLVDPQNPVYDIPGVIHGTVWSFTGVLSVPAITLQPVDMYVLPDPITHTLDNATATFYVEFNAGKPLDTIIWMKDGSPLTIDDAKYVQADEVGDLADASTMLTINNVGTADEGAYSVIITLLAGGAGSATSDEATLSVVLDTEILAHRWSFNNDLVDSVGGANGVIVDPADENITFTADEVIFGGRLEAGDNETSDDPNLHFVDLPNGIVSALGDHATFMTWYTIKDPAAPDNVRVFSAGDADGSGTEAEWVDGAWTGMTGDGAWIEIVTRGGDISFGSRGGGAVDARDGPASDYVDKEVCVAGVWDGSAGQMILYIDGVEADTASLNRKLSDLVDVSNWLGRSNSTADKTFVGSINELRIYGIPLTGPWVEALYKAGPDGEPLNVDPCHYPKDFDYDGDCMVNLIDFGIFAEQWLDCGFLSCQ